MFPPSPLTSLSFDSCFILSYVSISSQAEIFTATMGSSDCRWKITLEPVGLTPHGSIFCPSLQKQASCLLLEGRLRSLSPPSMAAFLRYCSALSSGGESTTRTPPEASLLLASSGPPSFASSAALHGGFSFAIAQRSLREASLRLASPARLR